MASEYEKMLRVTIIDLRTLNYGLWQKPLGRNRKLLTKRWILKKGVAIIKEWFGSTGENLYLNRQVLVDYGVNIHLGENFYANYNLTMLDICPITIGKNAMIGPNCQFLTPYTHWIQTSAILVWSMALRLQ